MSGMAVVGSYGEIVFEVSTDKIQTYNDFQRTNEPRWQEHAIIGQKPILEFEGPGVDKISFNVILRADFGVNPEEQLVKLRKFSRWGQKALFIRGNQPISTNYWVIGNLVEKHRNIDNLGNVLTIEVELNLKEYDNRTAISEAKKTMSSNQIPNNTSTSKTTIGTMTISVKSVHIRGGPGVDNKVLGYAMKGDKLTVYGEKDGWYSLGGGKYISANNAYSSFKKG